MKAMDTKAFEILVREHHRRILAFAVSLVRDRNAAEDLVQDAFLTAYLKLGTFDATRSFPAWVRGILRNKYYEYCRKHNEIAVEPASLDAMEDLQVHWETAATEDLDEFAALEQCLAKLDDGMAEPVDLFYMKRISSVDIAERLDIQVATIRKRLQRAREQLAVCITGTLCEGEQS